jgi:hypothetical protein
MVSSQDLKLRNSEFFPCCTDASVYPNRDPIIALGCNMAVVILLVMHIASHVQISKIALDLHIPVIVIDRT